MNFFLPIFAVLAMLCTLATGYETPALRGSVANENDLILVRACVCVLRSSASFWHSPFYMGSFPYMSSLHRGLSHFLPVAIYSSLLTSQQEQQPGRRLGIRSEFPPRIKGPVDEFMECLNLCLEYTFLTYNECWNECTSEAD